MTLKGYFFTLKKVLKKYFKSGINESRQELIFMEL